MQTVAGVDCHRDTHSVVFLNEVGRPLKELTIPTSMAGYEQALTAAAEFGDVRWGLESTGLLWQRFCEASPGERGVRLRSTGGLH